jgi:hypothetical protein
MPPNMPTISGDQNPHRKNDVKMSQSFLRVSLVPNDFGGLHPKSRHSRVIMDNTGWV